MIREIFTCNEFLEYNPIHHLLMFNADNHLVLHDLSNSKKSIMKFHKSTLKAIKFSLCWNLLFCIDSSDLPLLSFWKICNEDEGIVKSMNPKSAGMLRLKHLKLLDHLEIQISDPNDKPGLNPTNIRPNNFRTVFMNQISKDKLMVMLQTTSEVQFTFIFQINFKQELKTIYFERLDMAIPIFIGLGLIIPKSEQRQDKDKTDTKLNMKVNKELTTEEEDASIKYFACSDSHLIILVINRRSKHTRVITKILVKEGIVIDTLVVDNTRKLLFIKTKAGNLIVFDDKGNFIITFSPCQDYKDDEPNSITTFFIEDNALVWTEKDLTIKYIDLRNFNETYIIKGVEPGFDRLMINQSKNMMILRHNLSNAIRITNISTIFPKFSNKHCTHDNEAEILNISHCDSVNCIFSINSTSIVTIGSELIYWQYSEHKQLYIPQDYFSFRNCKGTAISRFTQDSFVVGTSLGEVYIFKFFAPEPTTEVTLKSLKEGNQFNMANDDSQSKGLRYLSLVSKLQTENQKVTSLTAFNDKIAVGFENGSVSLTEYDETRGEFYFCCSIQEKFLDFAKIKSRLNINWESCLTSFSYLLKFEAVSYENGDFNKLLVFGSQSNCVRLISLEEKLESKSIKTFDVVCLKELDFECDVIKIAVHKQSDSYIIVGLENNLIMISSLINEKLCGSISFSRQLLDFCLDTDTGLYILSKLYLKSEGTYLFSINELGTGRFVKTILNIGQVSSFTFSEYGITSFYRKGAMSHQDIPEDVKANIDKVKQDLQFDQNFWKSFSIEFKEIGDKQYIIRNSENCNGEDDDCINSKVKRVNPRVVEDDHIEKSKESSSAVKMKPKSTYLLKENLLASEIKTHQPETTFKTCIQQPSVSLKKLSIQEQARLKDEYTRLRNIEIALEELKSGKVKLHLAKQQEYFKPQTDNDPLDDQVDQGNQEKKEHIFSDPEDIDDVIENIKFSDLQNQKFMNDKLHSNGFK